MNINCDLGEGESATTGRALLASAQAINVACGGHAGSVAIMRRYALWCRDSPTALGAHPGTWDRSAHGRAIQTPRPEELELLLLQQVGALERVARAERVAVRHVKLHGALYHATERSATLARAYVKAIAHWWPRLRIIALAGGRVAQIARKAGLSVWEEAFADRGYQSDGMLIPRGQPHAILPPAQALAQALELMKKGTVRIPGGRSVPVRAQTLCVHADTPGAVALARRIAALRAALSSRDEPLRKQRDHKQ